MKTAENRTQGRLQFFLDITTGEVHMDFLGTVEPTDRLKLIFC